MQAQIRAAKMEDHETLEQLMLRVAESFPGYRDEMRALPDAFHVSSDHIRAGRIFVAELNGLIVGFAVWNPITDTLAELEGLVVDLPLQRCGIGSQLMPIVCEAVKASGRSKLFVAGIPQAAEFYRRCGFVRTGATGTLFGPAITMMKDIADLPVRELPGE